MFPLHGLDIASTPDRLQLSLGPSSLPHHIRIPDKCSALHSLAIVRQHMARSLQVKHPPWPNCGAAAHTCIVRDSSSSALADVADMMSGTAMPHVGQHRAPH